MDIKSYDDLVRDFHRDGYSWKKSQELVDDIFYPLFNIMNCNPIYNVNTESIQSEFKILKSKLEVLDKLDILSIRRKMNSLIRNNIRIRDEYH